MSSPCSRMPPEIWMAPLSRRRIIKMLPSSRTATPRDGHRVAVGLAHGRLSAPLVARAKSGRESSSSVTSCGWRPTFGHVAPLPVIALLKEGTGLARDRGPNSMLAALIEESGYTPTQLASRLNELSASYGRPASFNHTSVARWLRGERPRGSTVQLLVNVLSQAGGRRLSAAELGVQERARRADVGLAFD